MLHENSKKLITEQVGLGYCKSRIYSFKDDHVVKDFILEKMGPDGVYCSVDFLPRNMSEKQAMDCLEKCFSGKDRVRVVCITVHNNVIVDRDVLKSKFPIPVKKGKSKRR